MDDSHEIQAHLNNMDAAIFEEAIQGKGDVEVEPQNKLAFLRASRNILLAKREEQKARGYQHHENQLDNVKLHSVKIKYAIPLTR
jgi:hypothetical protein